MTDSILITDDSAPPGLLSSWAEYDDALWEEFAESFGDDITDQRNAQTHMGADFTLSVW